jgi:hypothetical protein
MLVYKDVNLGYNTYMLKKNSTGEVCIIAWDPRQEDDYIRAPEILIPLSNITSA